MMPRQLRNLVNSIHIFVHSFMQCSKELHLSSIFAVRGGFSLCLDPIRIFKELILLYFNINTPLTQDSFREVETLDPWRESLYFLHVCFQYLPVVDIRRLSNGCPELLLLRYQRLRYCRLMVSFICLLPLWSSQFQESVDTAYIIHRVLRTEDRPWLVLQLTARFQLFMRSASATYQFFGVSHTAP